MANLKNKLFGGAFLLLLSSCSMFSKQEPVRELPKSLMAFFNEPKQLEGGGVIKIANTEGLLFSGQSDYIQKGKLLETEVYDPLGGTVLKGSYNGEGFHFSGPMSKSFGKLSVDQAGFLAFDGHFIGLKMNELLALLQLRLPRTWLLLPKTRRKYDDLAAYVFSDKPRRIFARLDKSGDVLDLEVTWSAMLGLIEKKISVVCDRKNSRLEVNVGAFVMTWELAQDDGI